MDINKPSGNGASCNGSSRWYRRRANAERRWQAILRAAIIGAYCVVLLVAGLYLGYKGRERPEPEYASLPGTSEAQEPALPVSEGGASASSEDSPSSPTPSTVHATTPAASDETVAQTPEMQEAPQAPNGGTVSTTSSPEEAAVPIMNEDKPASGTGAESPTWPVQGEIVAKPRWVFSDYMEEWRYFPGVEIAVNPGTPVTASMSGKVVSVRIDPDLGTVVTLEHLGGMTTEYGRLSGCILGVGDTVKQGEEIARTDGTTFYFAAKVNDEAVMVTKYLTP